MTAVPKPTRRPKSKCTKCGRLFTARALLRHGAKCRAGGTNRFGNVAKKTKFSEYTFDSRLECDVYLELARQFDWRVIVKPHVYLTEARILCIPDFVVTLEGGEQIFHEAKGIRTPVWMIKRRLWQFYGPSKLNVWTRKGRAGIEITEVIVPKRSAT